MGDWFCTENVNLHIRSDSELNNFWVSLMDEFLFRSLKLRDCYIDLKPKLNKRYTFLPYFLNI